MTSAETERPVVATARRLWGGVVALRERRRRRPTNGEEAPTCTAAEAAAAVLLQRHVRGWIIRHGGGGDLSRLMHRCAQQFVVEWEAEVAAAETEPPGSIAPPRTGAADLCAAESDWVVSLATVPPSSRLDARGGGDARSGDAPAGDAPTRVLLSLLLLTPTEVVYTTTPTLTLTLTLTLALTLALT